MKEFLIILSLLFYTVLASGQSVIDEQFAHFQGQENFTTIQVSSKAFELVTYLDFSGEEEELQEFQSFLTTVKSFEMITGDSLVNAPQEYRNALETVGRTHEELMTVKEEGSIFTFFIDETNGTVHELVMVGNAMGNFMVFSLIGNMDIEQLSRMSPMLDIGEESQLRQLYDQGVHEVNVYPNPLQQGEAIIVEVPAEMADGTLTLIDMNGAVVKRVTLDAGQQKISTTNLPAGNYVLEFKNESLNLKKKVLIR